MKIVHTLLVLSAATIADASPAAPLVDVAGRPAVGNIGQRGRPAALPAAPAAEQQAIARVVVAPMLRLALPMARTAGPLVVLAPPAGEQAMTASMSPLVNSAERPAAGNTMGKRSRR